MHVKGDTLNSIELKTKIDHLNMHTGLSSILMIVSAHGCVKHADSDVIHRLSNNFCPLSIRLVWLRVRFGMKQSIWTIARLIARLYVRHTQHFRSVPRIMDNFPWTISMCLHISFWIQKICSTILRSVIRVCLFIYYIFCIFHYMFNYIFMNINTTLKI